MPDIKIHKKERIVVDETFETSDGQIFNDYSSAKHHQLMLEGKRIICPTCNGTRGANIDKGEWGYYEKWVWQPCGKCHGRGYLELKFA